MHANQYFALVSGELSCAFYSRTGLSTMGELAITVLIIDGYTDERKYWSERLKKSSPEYLVLEANSGAEGLAICRSQKIDCVVSELTLPDMPGFQLLVNLIPLARKPTIAVIILTRLDLPPIAQLARANGAHAYLVKSRASGDQLDMAIMKAVATVGPLAKEPQ